MKYAIVSPPFFEDTEVFYIYTYIYIYIYIFFFFWLHSVGLTVAYCHSLFFEYLGWCQVKNVNKLDNSLLSSFLVWLLMMHCGEE